MSTNENINHHICLDCAAILSKSKTRCDFCRSPRIISHSELYKLNFAHVDCDAFYASIEKSENEKIRDLPVIVGGGSKGVVTTCCYIARISGVRSAMPMFKALKLCPEAVIIKPRLDYYSKVSKEIQSKFKMLTPLVESISLDEAFLDFTGTKTLHQRSAAQLLAELAIDVERQFGISISIGLSHNKLLAKIASELSKPRGFSIIGKAETVDFLSDKHISLIWGVGPKMVKQLAQNGILKIRDLHRFSRKDLNLKYGKIGVNLWFYSRGIDNRVINPRKRNKSISTETTFTKNTVNFMELKKNLWFLTEKLSHKAKSLKLVSNSISLKLKSSNFETTTKSAKLSTHTNSAELMYQGALLLLQEKYSKNSYRLMGISLKNPSLEKDKKPQKDFFEQQNHKILITEKTIDNIRKKFGHTSIIKGRSL